MAAGPWKRGLAALVGAVVAVAAAELAMRVTEPYNVGRAGMELPLFREGGAERDELYVLDEELGFRPVFGTRLYDENGVRPGPLTAVPDADRERILFLGDSVTFRGRLQRALADAFGRERFEYLNGGVEAYNTVQEVTYFERYTSSLEPDHVVLTFHNNDFQSTPIAFHDGEGRLRVIAPSKHESQVNPWLFAHSHLYRYWIGSTRSPEEDEAERSIRAALERLAGLCRDSGAQLHVLVLPHLRPPDEWTETVARRHRFALETLAELGLRHLDLRPALEECLAAGEDVQESPGDADHPSDAFAKRAAVHVRDAGWWAR